MPRTDWSGVPERIAALAAHPRRHEVFGFGGHGFALEPPLAADDLAELESWLGVSLPDDYRAFLSGVGSGGAGPFYGVFPVRRGGAGWEWLGAGGEMIDRARMADGFPTDRVPDAELEALERERPQEDDFDSDDELDAALDRWDLRVEALLERPEITAGALCVAHEGCGYRDWLIVSGPARGTMWEDPRCIDRDLKPMLTAEAGEITFGDWYLNWLDACERTLGLPRSQHITVVG